MIFFIDGVSRHFYSNDPAGKKDSPPMNRLFARSLALTPFLRPSSAAQENQLLPDRFG